jgi:putative ABC transport system substrate-binding protein
MIVMLIAGAAAAQPTGRVPRVGVLSPAPAAAASGSPFDGFRDELQKLGYVDGKNIGLEWRFAGGNMTRLTELAGELVRLPVDVIVTDGGNSVARVAAAATRTIPIVMGTASDPVESGLVASLPRPGGNVTGFTLSDANLAGKRLQLLKEILPTVNRVAVLWDADTAESQFRAAAAAAPSLGVQLESLPVRTATDLDAAFDTARRQRAGGLLQLPSRRMFDNRRAIAERALRYRLPGLFELGVEETGALASYGPSVGDNFREAARYVDKILKGARPGDLPVGQPSKFYLVINLKTAKMLGLTVPAPVLLQATRIIE